MIYFDLELPAEQVNLALTPSRWNISKKEFITFYKNYIPGYNCFETKNNARLFFLGNFLMKLAVAEEGLWYRFAKKQTGLFAPQANWGKREHVAQMAVQLGISLSQLKNSGCETHLVDEYVVLNDCFKALISLVFKSYGQEICRKTLAKALHTEYSRNLAGLNQLAAELLKENDVRVEIQTNNLKNVQQYIGQQFKHKHLLISCIRLDIKAHNPVFRELELIGDAVLDLALADLLLEMYPTYNPVALNTLRDRLVSGDMLRNLVKEKGWYSFLVLDYRQVHSVLNAKRNKYIGDFVESIIGLIYLEQGWNIVREWIAINFYPVVRMVNRQFVSVQKRLSLKCHQR